MALFGKGPPRAGQAKGRACTKKNALKLIIVTIPLSVGLYLMLTALHYSARHRAALAGGGATKELKKTAREMPLEEITAARADLGGTKFIDERPWKDATPGWCADLIKEPRERVRGHGNCGQGPQGTVCSDGKPRFFGQENQDMWVWQNHFRHLKRPGTYLDIAANEPVEISNTFFFDRCLNWKGLCVEAHPKYIDNLVKMRTCSLVQTCVSNQKEKVTFVMYLGLSGIADTNKNTQILRTSPRMELNCVTTARAIDAGGMQHFDILSLDVEGHEHKVLEGIDWEKTRINVIIIESLQPHTETYLIKLGYRKLPVPVTAEEKGKEGALYQDAVFAYKDVVWGAPV